MKAHIRPTLLLAYPVIISQIGHIMVNICDSVMVGQTGKLPLAAVSVGGSSVVVLLVLGLGISMGAVPRVAAANGRGDNAALGHLLVGTIWLNTLVGVLLAGLSQLLPWVLPHLDQVPEVVALATPWVRVVGLSLLPVMVFQGFREWAEGLGLTRQAMQLSILGNVLNALLCYVLVFGHFGAPALGLMGTAWATLVSRVVMAVLMALYVLLAEPLRPKRPVSAEAWQRPGLAELRGQLALGLPIGAHMMLEVGAFATSALLMGRLGVSTQAAHQIAINVASATFMVASGIAAATTIRVSSLRGASDLPGARQAAIASFWLTFGFMSLMGVLLVVFRHWLPLFYNTDPLVVAQAATMLAVAAAFQVSDGLQVVGLGALRGLEDVKIPSVVALLAYWAVALPLGYALGFWLHWGAMGIWLGLLVGLTVVAVLLLVRFLRLSQPGQPLPPTTTPPADELVAAEELLALSNRQ